MTEKQLYLRVKLIAAAAVIIVLALLLYIVMQCVNVSKINAQTAEIKRQKEYLARQAQALEDEIDNISTRQFIERYAREKLGYGYKGESRYIINDSKED